MEIKSLKEQYELSLNENDYLQRIYRLKEFIDCEYNIIKIENRISELKHKK